MNPFIKPTTTGRPRSPRFVAVGIVAAGLSVVCAGVATAVVPFAPTPTPTPVATASVDWSGMPRGYNQAQYEAFWGAGYSAEDVVKLNDLWKSDSIQTKARAGQMILDGDVLPVAPSPAVAQPADDLSTPREGDQAKYEAFWNAGYTDANLATLNDLWKTGSFDTKARAGKMILEGKTPPVAPSGTSRHRKS
ncbi:MAG TPA: hypothetical protein VGK17_06300 [Propionicimonas sp.]|jgi:hypothetical protein